MKRLKRYQYRTISSRVCNCERKEHEVVVRDGLAYSPSDMARLQSRGMPVNGLNTSNAFFDGEENPSFDVGSERQRFVDVADLWEEHMNIRDKARKAARASRLSKKSKSTEK